MTGKTHCNDGARNDDGVGFVLLSMTIDVRSVFVALSAILTIAYSAFQLRPYGHRWIDPDTLAAITGLAASALIGYPFVLAGAYVGSYVARDSGKGMAIALLVFFAIWGLTFMGFGFFMGAMQTKPFDQALFFGAVAMIAGIFVAAAWAIGGGEPTRLQSWQLPTGLFLIVVIAACWRMVLEITSTRWDENRVKIGAIYGVTVALFTVAVALAVRLALQVAADYRRP